MIVIMKSYIVAFNGSERKINQLHFNTKRDEVTVKTLLLQLAFIVRKDIGVSVIQDDIVVPNTWPTYAS